MKKTRKEITLSLEFNEGRQDSEKGIFEGNVEQPKHLNELCIDVSKTQGYDLETDDFKDTGQWDIQIQGTNRAFRELGKYFLAITEYQTDDPGYHDHFDAIVDSEDEEKINLLIYKPNK